MPMTIKTPNLQTNPIKNGDGEFLLALIGIATPLSLFILR